MGLGGARTSLMGLGGPRTSPMGLGGARTSHLACGAGEGLEESGTALDVPHGLRCLRLDDDIASVTYWYHAEPHAPFPKLPQLAKRAANVLPAPVGAKEPAR
jgi:hypothetical protein